MRGRREERLRIEPTRPSVYREGTGSGAEIRQSSHRNIGRVDFKNYLNI